MDSLNKKIKITYLLALSAIVAVVFVTIVTIVGEEYKPLKKLLGDIFTHHWIGKSVVAVVLFVFTFVVGSFLALKPKEKCASRMLWAFFIAIILGTIILSAYFVLHWFGLT